MGLKDDKVLNLRVHPIPTRDRIYISGIQNDNQIEVFSIDSRKVVQHRVTEEVSLGLNSDFGLSSGIYLMRLESQGKSLNKKIMVE